MFGEGVNYLVTNFNPIIRSKCFVFKLAHGMSNFIAVAAIKRSAMSNRLLLFFKAESISTAVFTISESKGTTDIRSRKPSQYLLCSSFAPE